MTNRLLKTPDTTSGVGIFPMTAENFLAASRKQFRVHASNLTLTCLALCFACRHSPDSKPFQGQIAFANGQQLHAVALILSCSSGGRHGGFLALSS